MKRSIAIDMTTGKVRSQILRFALPLLIGNIFQQLYNTVDSIVVGRFVGKQALAALGVASPVMNIVLFTVIGLCTGASIYMATLWGEGDMEKCRREFSTCILAGLVFTAAVSLAAIFCIRQILNLLRTPAELIGQATAYLQVIFGGLVFSYLYNIYTAALRAAGDSASPLYFLVISSVINILLDLLFVPVFHWGAVGAAAATVLAQAVSALLCYLYTAKQFPQLHLRRSDLVLDSRLLRTTIGYSQSAALQQTCFFIGKLLLQGAINPLGTDTIAAFNAVSRIEGFVLAPGNSIATAITTFIAQNKGARKPDRIFEGFGHGCKMAWGYDILMVIFMYLFASPMTALFVDAGETAVVAEGVRYLHAMCPFYLLPAMGDVMQGFFRGIGKLNVSLFGTIFQISIRVTLTYLLAGSLGLVSVSIATGTGWCLFLLALAFLYRREKPRVLRALSSAPTCC
ncbi:MAG TPA: MATE family efflux transporter [Candidatus Pygmaiobacter gallistercoris]|nr:MATE family efflux transporter [Candidatus Pygmaiobacter gallistercoris]